jgi:hypothetical protein
MKITIKKALATIAMLSILGGLALNVNAAAIDVDSVTYDDGTDTITVTDAGKDYTGDVLTTFRLTDEDGATVAGITVTDVTEANGSFTATNVAIDGLTDGVYSIAFVTTNGDFSSAIFVVGNANEVQVTANVLPILTMKLTGGAVAFGDLVADTATTAGTQTSIAINTNAANGYTLQVANVGLIDGTNQIPDASTDEDLASGYGYGINATINAGATIDAKASATGTVDGDFDGAAQVVTGMSTTPATLASSTGPVSAQSTTVSYHTRISALQETGNYTDTIIYSLSGSF